MLSLTVEDIKGWGYVTQHNGIQHNDTLQNSKLKRDPRHNGRALLCWVSFMLSFTRNPFVLSVVMLNIMMLSIIMLNVIVLSVIMLSVAAPSTGNFLGSTICLYLFFIWYLLKACLHYCKNCAKLVGFINAKCFFLFFKNC